MSGDIRQQLIEALDQAEERARGLLVAAQRTSLMLKEPRLLGLQIPGWHAWPDVEAMCARELRLIERDRQLLADYEEAYTAQQARASQPSLLLPPYPEQRGSVKDGWMFAGRVNTLRSQVERAAVFWFGTPEVDR